MRSLPAVTHLSLLPFALLLAVLPFPGTVALRLLCLVSATLVAAIHVARTAGPRRLDVPCKAALTLWIVVCGASLIYSAVPSYSIGEFKNEVVYTMLAFFAFVTIARYREAVEHLLGAFAAGFAIIGCWAAIAWFSNGFVWDERGGHGGIGVFSAYIVTAVPALLWLAFAGSRPTWRIAAVVLLALAFVLAFATLQRAVWPALFAEIVVAGIFLYGRGRSGRRGAVVISLVCALVIVGFYTSSLWRTNGQTVVVSLTSDDRLPAWRAMTNKVVEHPIAGVGFGRGSMGRAYPDLIPVANPLISHPHNVFLNYAIGMGIPGLAVLVALFLCLAKAFSRLATSNHEDIAVAGVCGAMLVAGVVTRNLFNDFFNRDMSMLFWSLVGIFLGHAARISDKRALTT